MPETKPVSLARIAMVALKSGLLGFGGGFAVIPRIRRDTVERWKWLAEDAFLEDVAVAVSLPGTTATNVFAMIGHRVRGIVGAFVASCAFIAPSVTLMIVFGALYEKIRGVTAMRPVFDGMSAAVVGVILALALDLRRDALKRALDWIVAALVCGLLATRLAHLVVLVLAAGLLGVIADRSRKPAANVFVLAPIFVGAVGASTVASVFFAFVKIGAATFGGGYAMVPSIAHEVVSHGWLDERTFADAIALGQVTPGPVAVSATFVGYRVAGVPGALAATLGIFGPPFVFAILAARSLSRFRESATLRGFLRGTAPAVVGMIGAAAYFVAKASVDSWLTGAIAIGSLAIRAKWRRSSPALPLALGAAVALVATWVR